MLARPYLLSARPASEYLGDVPAGAERRATSRSERRGSGFTANRDALVPSNALSKSPNRSGGALQVLIIAGRLVGAWMMTEYCPLAEMRSSQEP